MKQYGKQTGIIILYSRQKIGLYLSQSSRSPKLASLNEGTFIEIVFCFLDRFSGYLIVERSVTQSRRSKEVQKPF